MKVIMVGRPDLQTDLLLSLVRDRLTADCRLFSDGDFPLDVNVATLYVLDLAVLGFTACAEALNALNARGILRAAVINADTHPNQAQLAALPGVCGLFSRDTSADAFVRGIKAIMTGEYWLPRRVLCEHLEQTRHIHRPRALENSVKLSNKERQLLSLLTQGCSNEAIAIRLAISPHTVKTHFYNLYRKLQVRNRVQAATWAQQNSEFLLGA